MRLTLDIPEEAHRQIKTLASFHGMSMKDFILKKTLEEHESEDATALLLEDPANAARLRESLAQADAGRVTSFNTIEELRRAVGLD